MMRMEINDGLRRSDKKWELRPGGMLVQKRTDEDDSRLPPRKIMVRVKHGEIVHQIHISSEASFGELKKLLSEVTGLHHQDQKLLYKNRERDSKAFLDTAGVKEKSKLVLLEDPISIEKRYLEMKKKSQIEKASIIVSHISLQIDKLAKQVSTLENLISKGEKVVQNDLIKLSDSFMNQLLQLDNVPADCDTKLQQEKRVQEYVEKLDVLKLKNSSPSANIETSEKQTKSGKQQKNKTVRFSFVDQQDKNSSLGTPTVVTTEWESFDSTMNPLVDAPSSSATATKDHPVQRGFTWNLL